MLRVRLMREDDMFEFESVPFEIRCPHVASGDFHIVSKGSKIIRIRRRFVQKDYRRVVSNVFSGVPEELAPVLRCRFGT